MRVLVVAALVACSAPTFRVVDLAGGPAVTRANIRVLANREARCADAMRSTKLAVCTTHIALLAETAEQLGDLWTAVGAGGPLPKVDFQRNVVLGTIYGGGECEGRPDAARIDAKRVLTLEIIHRTNRFCSGMLIPITRVVEVPRSILSPEFTWKHEGRAYEFALAR